MLRRTFPHGLVFDQSCHHPPHSYPRSCPPLPRWLTAGEVEDKYSEFLVDVDRLERAERRMAEDWTSDTEENRDEEGGVGERGEGEASEPEEAAELLRKAPRLFQDIAEQALVTGRHIRSLKGHGYKLKVGERGGKGREVKFLACGYLACYETSCPR